MGARAAAAIIVVGLVVRHFVEGIPLQTSYNACCEKFGQPLSDICKYMVDASDNIGCLVTATDKTEQLIHPSFEKRGPKLILLDMPDYMNRRKLLLKKLKTNVADKNGYFNPLIDQYEE